EFSTNIIKDPSVLKDYTIPYTEEQAMDILKDRENVSATVDTSGDAAKLMINGEATPSVFYKFQAGSSDEKSGDEENFTKDGINNVTTQIRLGGPENQVPFWKGSGEYDFEVIDNKLIETL